MKKLILSLAIILFAVSFTSCENDEPTPNNNSEVENPQNNNSLVGTWMSIAAVNRYYITFYDGIFENHWQANIIEEDGYFLTGGRKGFDDPQMVEYNYNSEISYNYLNQKIEIGELIWTAERPHYELHCFDDGRCEGIFTTKMVTYTAKIQWWSETEFMFILNDDEIRFIKIR